MLMPKLLTAAPSKSAELLVALGDEEVVPFADPVAMAVPVLLEEELELAMGAAELELEAAAAAGASLEWQMPVARVSGGMS
jgi:hypothetical protein